MHIRNQKCCNIFVNFENKCSSTVLLAQRTKEVYITNYENNYLLLLYFVSYFLKETNCVSLDNRNQKRKLGGLISPSIKYIGLNEALFLVSK